MNIDDDDDPVVFLIFIGRCLTCGSSYSCNSNLIDRVLPPAGCDIDVDNIDRGIRRKGDDSGDGDSDSDCGGDSDTYGGGDGDSDSDAYGGGDGDCDGGANDDIPSLSMNDATPCSSGDDTSGLDEVAGEGGCEMEEDEANVTRPTLRSLGSTYCRPNDENMSPSDRHSTFGPVHKSMLTDREKRRKMMNKNEYRYRMRMITCLPFRHSLLSLLSSSMLPIITSGR